MTTLNAEEQVRLRHLVRLVGDPPLIAEDELVMYLDLQELMDVYMELPLGPHESFHKRLATDPPPLSPEEAALYVSVHERLERIADAVQKELAARKQKEH
jgi:hypothetical protein